MNLGHVLLTVQEHAESQARQIDCSVKRVIPGELHLISDCPLPIQAVAKAEFGAGYTVKGQILGCMAAADGYLVSFLHRGSERRREQRFPVNQSGRMKPNLEQDAPDVTVRICDVSRNGMGIECSSRLPEGSSVCVQTDQGLVFGTVRHCDPVQNGFRAGILIDEAFVRSPEDRKANEQAGFLHALSKLKIRWVS